MQSQVIRSPAQQPQAVNPRPGLASPRERAPEENTRPGAAVALEPKWAAAIDAATD